MKRSRSPSLSFLLILLAILFVTFSTVCVEARKSQVKKNNAQKQRKPRNGNGPAPAPGPSSSFNILSFGAKGDGVSDDSKVKLLKQIQTAVIPTLFEADHPSL